MSKPNLFKAKKKIHKIKKQSWFRPISWILLVAIIVLLVFCSASFARISSQRSTSYHDYNMENVSSSGTNAYDLYSDLDDTNTSRNTRNGLRVTLGNLYDKTAENTDREVVITGDANNDSFNQGMAGSLEQMEMRIQENILSEMESHYSEVIEGATGKEGLAGEPGQPGIQGERGLPGAVGKTGATGQSGSVGATGPQGETGNSGQDGLSTFIAYADNAKGTNMGSTPKETSKYIGTYQGTIRSSDPKDYTWTEYKDKIITYENDGKPTLKIFN